MRRSQSVGGSLAAELSGEPQNMVLTVRAGRSETQGKREYMEDRTTLIENLLEGQEGEDLAVSYFAVFDGHAGRRAADICSSNIHQMVCEHSDFPEGDMAIILRETISAQDELIITQSIAENWKDGSCASVLVIRGNKLTAANLGDSHMILAQTVSGLTQPIRISETHKASEDTEKKRIIAAGGMVVRNRVFGDLSISRALGDRDYKHPAQETDFVSSIAYTKSVTLNVDHPFAIISSDGLWDKLTFQEAVDHIIELKKDPSITPEQASASLIDTATTR